MDGNPVSRLAHQQGTVLSYTAKEKMVVQAGFSGVVRSPYQYDYLYRRSGESVPCYDCVPGWDMGGLRGLRVEKIICGGYVFQCGVCFWRPV